MSALLERASRYQIRPMYACDANGVGPSTAFGPESESQRSAGSGGQSYSQTPSSQDGGAHGRGRKSTPHKARGDAASLDTGWQALWMQLLKRVADQDDTIRQMKGDMHDLGGTLAKVVTTNTKLHEELATIRSSHATAKADVAQVVQDAMRREGQAQEARLQQAVDDMRKLVVDSAGSLRQDAAPPSSSIPLEGAGTKSVNKKRRASEFAAAPDDALDDDADAAGGELAAVAQRSAQQWRRLHRGEVPALGARQPGEVAGRRLKHRPKLSVVDRTGAVWIVHFEQRVRELGLRDVRRHELADDGEELAA